MLYIRQNMIQNAQKQANNNNLLLSSVKYELKQNSFTVPLKFQKEVPLNKNIFELNEPLTKKYGQKTSNYQTQINQMLDPIQMNISSIKLMFIAKINSYLTIFSILVSLYQVYATEGDDYSTIEDLTLLNFGITAILFIQAIISFYYDYQSRVARRFSKKLNIFKIILILCIILPAPTPWTTQINNLLHLTLMLRLYIPLEYYIYSNMYYESRAARITNIYGMKPQATFRFAVKVILNQKNISQVLVVYFGIVLFYSHCLYLVTDKPSYIDCFEIVIVTLPTIGFGQQRLQGTPRLIILFILVTGIALNAFVTIVMLKNFQMTFNQSQSYMLMEKLNIVQEIQSLSSQFIIRKIRKRKFDISELTEEDPYKQKYKECKNRYRMLNIKDSIYQFTFFHNQLNDLNVKMIQTNNMVKVLINRLASSQKQRFRQQFKQMAHQT